MLLNVVDTVSLKILQKKINGKKIAAVRFRSRSGSDLRLLGVDDGGGERRCLLSHSSSSLATVSLCLAFLRVVVRASLLRQK